jgi:hypothetical protein
MNAFFQRTVQRTALTPALSPGRGWTLLLSRTSGVRRADGAQPLTNSERRRLGRGLSILRCIRQALPLPAGESRGEGMQIPATCRQPRRPEKEHHA